MPWRRSRSTHLGTEAQKHGKDVLAEEFSWNNAGDAVCFDCPPPPMDADPKAFDDHSIAESQSLIPLSSALIALSLGGCTQTRSATK